MLCLCYTHDLTEAAYLGDEVLLMKAGRPIQRGTLSELRDEPATPFVKEFVDTTLRTLQRDGAE